MTVTGGFPAPGPQDREPRRDEPYVAPMAAGPPSRPAPPGLKADKPGIVPLRPLELGDILDGAVKAVRFNPKSMVGLSALVLGAFLVPSAALGIGTTSLALRSLSRFGPEAQPFVGLPAAFIQGMFSALASTILSGLLVHVVGQAVLGRKPDIGQTWQATRGLLLRVLALAFFTGLFSLLAAAMLIGPGVLLLVNENIASGIILLIVGSLGFFVLAVTVSTKISMAAPAIVLEGHGVLSGVRRSFGLTRGNAFWRVLGITLLAGIIAGIAGYLLGLPFLIIGPLVVTVGGLGAESGQMALTFISHLSALVSGAITTPFTAAVTCLLYLDRRMRLEALDVVLMRHAQDNPSPRI